MKRSTRGTALVVTLSAVLCIQATPCCAQAVATAPARLHFVDPRHKTAAQIDIDPALFGWDMFVFVNWPEFPGQRGVPNTKREIGDRGATVWESFKNVSEVYPSNGGRPAAWEIDDELPPIPSVRAAISKLEAVKPVDSRWVHFLAEPVMIDGQRICDATSHFIHYDVRGNKSYFDYVVNNISGHQLYNTEGQLAALADPTFTFNFPSDTVEVKASWRILDSSDDSSRYWTAIGVYYDTNGSLRASRIGLTGLHITSKALPNWVWITFEQVDNHDQTYKWNLGAKRGEVGPNPNYDKRLTQLNKEFQQALAEINAKWQYYALMKVQTAYVDAAKQPILSSNTQMETYFQSKSSCISCHTLASIGNPQNPSQAFRLKFFYPLNPYVGNIDFQQIANKQFPGESFKAMDFVWSLRNAHYANPPANKAKPASGK